MCQFVSQSISKRSASRILDQSSHHGRVPGYVVTYCFWWKSKIFMCVKLEVENMEVLMSNVWKMVRHHVEFNGGQIRNHACAFNWHHDL